MKDQIAKIKLWWGKIGKENRRTIMLSTLLAGFLAIAVIFWGLVLGWWGQSIMESKFVEELKDENGFFAQLDLVADGKKETGPKSPISGVSCKNWNRRPFAVMVASDAITRDNSAGFSEADLVFEVKASSSGLPRLMAVFVCNSPKDIGSIRSAREQFVPIAKSLDAILTHWGGEHNVHDTLKAGAIDNLDALGRGSGAFYRKSGIPAPHNGYTTTEKIMEQAKSLKYRLTSKLSAFEHEDEKPKSERPEGGKLTVPYGGVSNVEYSYDKESNTYKRMWGGRLHHDTNNHEQVAPRVVVVMRAKSQRWYSQYNRVAIEGGSGKIDVYQNGTTFSGTWKHDEDNNKLTFSDSSGNPVKFIPGQIWLNVVDPGDTVTWEQ